VEIFELCKNFEFHIKLKIHKNANSYSIIKSQKTRPDFRNQENMLAEH